MIALALVLGVAHGCVCGDGAYLGVYPEEGVELPTNASFWIMTGLPVDSVSVRADDTDVPFDWLTVLDAQERVFRIRPTTPLPAQSEVSVHVDGRAFAFRTGMEADHSAPDVSGEATVESVDGLSGFSCTDFASLRVAVDAVDDHPMLTAVHDEEGRLLFMGPGTSLDRVHTAECGGPPRSQLTDGRYLVTVVDIAGNETDAVPLGDWTDAPHSRGCACGSRSLALLPLLGLAMGRRRQRRQGGG